MRLLFSLVLIALVLGTVNAQSVFYVTHQPSCLEYQYFLGWIDPDTGVMTPVGPLGRFVRSIVFGDDGVLYGLSMNDLVRIEPDTGATTVVGSLGVQGLRGLAVAGPGTLWGFHSTQYTYDLYTIDTASGATTLVGTIDGLVTDGFTLQSLVTINDVLYGVGWNLFKIDPDNLTIELSGPLGPLVSKVTAAAESGRLWSTMVDAHGWLNPPQWLGTVDLDTGEFSATSQIFHEVAPFGMAYREGPPPDSPYAPCPPPPDVPTIGGRGAAILAALILLAAAFLLPRARRLH